MQVIERTEGHYDAHEVEFGTVYKWCPECVVVECDCGERPTLSGLVTTCGWCGADHATVIREELDARQLEDEAVHPWRYAGEREDTGLPC